MNLSFDNPLFLIPALTGVIFVIAGLILLKYPPKNINALYGYRTNSSMKTKERWTFAQKYSAIEMTKLGGLLTLSGLLGFFLNTTSTIGVIIGVGLMIITIIVLLTRVENAIKNRFNK